MVMGLGPTEICIIGLPIIILVAILVFLKYFLKESKETKIKRVRYAGFWVRLVAFIIDRIILTVFSFVFGLGIGVLFGIGIVLSGVDESWAFDVIMDIISVIFAIVVSWIYFAVMESSSKQATLGKMLLGIKVTDMDNKRITFGRASIRFFGKFLSGLLLGIGFLMIGFTEKKQGLHDKLAGCLVVKDDTPKKDVKVSAERNMK